MDSVKTNERNSISIEDEKTESSIDEEVTQEETATEIKIAPIRPDEFTADSNQFDYLLKTNRFLVIQLNQARKKNEELVEKYNQRIKEFSNRMKALENRIEQLTKAKERKFLVPKSLIEDILKENTEVEI